MTPTQCYLSAMILAWTSTAAAGEATDQPHPTPYSPKLQHSVPIQVFWGDTHVHSKLSFDAFPLGNNLGPEQAYRFAKGEAVTTYNGTSAQLARPLDFLVIADHAVGMGMIDGVLENRIPRDDAGKEQGADSAFAQLIAWFDTNSAATERQIYEGMRYIRDLSPTETQAASRHIWQRSIQAAEKHYQPGVFTPLIGFEWSAKFNLHRVVIFKDNAEKVGQVLPYAAHPIYLDDRSDPASLWAYMQAYEDKTGGEILAIPHNGNMSDGVMFALEDAKGNALSRDYAATRSRWEPLYEVTQVKGDSETLPLLSPEDEFADFERIVFGGSTIPNYLEGLRKQGYLDYQSWVDKRKQTAANDNWMRTYEYARSGLKLGLAQQHKLGINPFKFGLIGSTDAHNSLSSADNNNYWGKHAAAGPSKDRSLKPWDPRDLLNNQASTDAQSPPSPWSQGWRQNAAGYAGVWAEENTREALFAAMKRKEVYASTGPRMTLRFFGGWDYQSDDAFKPDLAQIGYRKGVPMGGDLTQAPEDKAPQFLIRAVKDPDGANLDRVQVIKGWHDKNGELHEKIYNVALSDGRQENRRGSVKPVGSTVDIADASYTNTIGDPELAVVWQDPDFNPDELAFYYVRVLEIPTPRWPAYDAKRFAVKELPAEVTLVTQERAYSSPIWYSPAQHKGG